MARKPPSHARIIIDGHDISRHTIEATLKIKHGHFNVLALELIEPTVHTDPHTGEITFTVGTSAPPT